MKLEHKTALITGGAQRIGKQIALALAQKQVNIVVHYNRSVEEANRTQQELLELGVEATVVQANLASLDSIQTLFQQLKDGGITLDIVVNNASSFVKEPFTRITPESWAKAIDVNLRAPVFISQYALPLLQATSSDKLIVNIADLSGVYPWKDFVQHGIAKAGLIHFTKILARELAPQIRVNAIIPGPILPPASHTMSVTKWQAMTTALPLKRSGRPVHIAQTILYLATTDFVTGAIINVDGGENLVGAKTH